MASDLERRHPEFLAAAMLHLEMETWSSYAPMMMHYDSEMKRYTWGGKGKESG